MERREAYFLLVDDDDDHAEIVMRTLRAERMTGRIDRVTDGAAALAYLRKEGRFQGRPTPDVVLLDLRLPIKDGHEVLADIRSDPKLRHLPVVVLTTSDDEADRAKAYASQANSYVVKPGDLAQFRRLISDISTYWGDWNRGPSRG